MATENKKTTDADNSIDEKQEDKSKIVDKAKKPVAKPSKATPAVPKIPKKENAEQKSEENGDGDKKPTDIEAEPKNDKKAAGVSNEKQVKKTESSEKEDDQDEDGEENDKASEEEDEDDTPKKKALLDLPLEVSGARERKKVERLAVGFNVTKEKTIGEGEGDKLSDIPQFEANLTKMKPADLKPFHKLLFNRPGTVTEIKKNIRSFNGFSFKSFSPDYDKKKAVIEKLTIPVLKKMCSLLFLDKSGTKEEIGTTLLDFLMKPESTGTSAKTKKRPVPKKSSEKPKPRQGARASSRKRKSKSYAEVSDSEHEEEDVKEDDEEEMEEEVEEKKSKVVTEENEASEEDSEEKMESEGKEDSDDDWNKNMKKNKPTPKKANVKAPPKKEETRKQNAEKDAPKEKKAPARSKAKQKKAASSEEEEESSDDDEPLAKKSKKPPTDEELKTLIKKILDGANLEEITMKTVCKQVYASFPDFDLSDRKEFIKGTVRSIIS